MLPRCTKKGRLSTTEDQGWNVLYFCSVVVFETSLVTYHELKPLLRSAWPLPTLAIIAAVGVLSLDSIVFSSNRRTDIGWQTPTPTDAYCTQTDGWMDGRSSTLPPRRAERMRQRNQIDKQTDRHEQTEKQKTVCPHLTVVMFRLQYWL